MGVIRVGRPDHLTSVDARIMVRDRYGVSEITDACAVTVASWWQSPGQYGMPFTALSTTGTVGYQELSDAIHRERKGLDNMSNDAKALDMLGTWALAQTRVRYASVIFLQGDDYHEFEAVLYPDSAKDSPRIVLSGTPNVDGALEYLAQWDQGEPTSDEVFGECLTEYPFCFKGNDQSHETDEYVMVWSSSYGVAGLWRKVTGE